MTDDWYNFFFVQFYVSFKIISAHNETGQSVGGPKMGEPREKPPGTHASRTWLVSRGHSGARTYTRHSGEMNE